MNFICKNWKGTLLCLVIALPCWWLGKRFPIVGGPVFAIVSGMIVTLFIRDRSTLQSGITFVSKKVLQYAVILLGFGMNLSVILQTGKQSLPIILVTITTSLVIAWALHKLLHIPGKISTLIGVGSSICGGSAIAATAPVIDADDGGGASPAVFVYTLPNIMLGQIAIKHGLKGESTFFAFPDKSCNFIRKYAEGLIAQGRMDAVVWGWCELCGGEYDCELTLTEKLE